MLKILVIALLMGAAQHLPSYITAQDLVHIERVTVSHDGVQLDYSEGYCIDNDLDYRGYWIEFGK